MAMAHKEQRAGAPTLSPPPRLRVLDTTLVPPSPSGSPPPECSLPLTIYDTFWLPFPPVERLFLYRLTPDADVQAILSNLKLALSRAIHAFYPLAGRIRLTPGTSDRYELHYRPGDGVIFTVAEYDGGLATDDPRAIAPLVPALPAGGAAVLALQATLLPAHRRGLAVGVAVNHAAVDGSASTHFLHSWAAAAAACAHTNSPPAPVIDRSLLPVALFQPCQPSIRWNSTCPPASSSPRSLCTGKTSSASRTPWPPRPRAGGSRRRPGARRWSPPSVSSGRATTTPGASTDGDGRTCLLFSIDHRSRMSPPLPDKYLGNCVGPALAVAPKDALAAGDLLSACAAVTAAIDEAVSGVRTASMGAWTDRLREVAGAMSMLPVAGSPRFRVYEMDLGFGRPEKVDIVSVARTDALAVAESRRGDGGMEVGVPLPPDDMARFRTCFADAIAGLHARKDMS
ncbi:hypothetical protein HU200_012241 [Digitaria exilis]|uniref:Uncharacterized protein n=1 Tax=Digitaria exilis TaxID=1010633 RepID=A0A835FF80_9POAL|nr:hypothetical protein HU200_012241 [Digitaria exilis]